MTYYGAKDLASSFRTVRKNTIAIATDIPEQHYGYRAAPETRTVSQMLVHIAQITQMTNQIHAVEKRTALEGFDFMSFMQRLGAEEQTPRTRQQILDMLKADGEKFAQWLEGVDDKFLAERVTMPTGMTPDSKTRFEMLMSVKEHEMHHRGQLMLIERLLGIVPHMTRDMQAMIASRMQAQAAR